ncbi:MAG: radical SAM protein [Spirochaetes bacterium]|nr:radical SAM protein [Spirochaetota bacterium]MBN2771909.1 radical SAM protein [Spirochaetota bacterium]
MKNTILHPCFDKNGSKHAGRLHLPVAPKCNIQCGFCNRTYDCVNESRPGVTSAIITPHQALLYTQEMLQKMPDITTIGIAGPGDAFANGDETLETIELIRNVFPEMFFCVSTNGLALPKYISEIADAGLTHLTITINAVDPEIGAEIYQYVHYKKHHFTGIEGAEILLANQLEGLRIAVSKDIKVKINSVVIPGVNDHHIIDIARTIGELGAVTHNCMGLITVKDTKFGNKKAPSPSEINDIRAKASPFISQMTHCGRCRADAAGLIHKQNSTETLSLLNSISQKSDIPNKPRTLSAVASEEGLLINRHLGETEEFLIYSLSDDGKIQLIEKRTAPKEGTPDRWEDLSRILNDCSDIFVSGAGSTPKTVLGNNGQTIQIVEGLIDNVLKSHYKGDSLKRFQPLGSHSCGASCSGNAQGCM